MTAIGYAAAMTGRLTPAVDIEMAPTEVEVFHPARPDLEGLDTEVKQTTYEINLSGIYTCSIY